MATPSSRHEANDRQGAMSRLAAGLGTKAAKVRALDAGGYSRSEIAAFLGISYQHVRNVLGPMAKLQAVDAATAPTEDEESLGSVTVGEHGRIELPEHVRKAIGATSGREIAWRFEDDTFMLMGREAGLRWAQAMVRKYVDPDVSLVDDLIAGRRREVAKEEREYGESRGLRVAEERTPYDAGE